MLRAHASRRYGITVAVLAFTAIGCPSPRSDAPDAGSIDPMRAGDSDQKGHDGPIDDDPGAGDAAAGSCVDGSPCTLTDDPCRAGTRSCNGGTSTCMATDKAIAAGSPCGAGKVCAGFQCVGCAGGSTCPVPGKPCLTGVLDCSSGKSECVENGNAPNGQDCGAGMVCKDGACNACSAGDPCVPSNPCHTGTLACAGGVASCVDSNHPAAAGAACGPNMVCSASGACAACATGAACQPANPCHAGKTDCTTGTPACMDAGNVANGTSCGSGKVCSEGACVSCSDGMACAPTNQCHTGTLSCTSGTAKCDDTQMALSDGSACGTNHYCSNGTCNACTPGASCAPGNPCRVGKTSCDTGTSQCQESGNASNGKMCGSQMYCLDGNCHSCNQGGPCTPTNTCKTGTVSCTTGAEKCMESGNVGDGTSCGSGHVCKGGSCAACDAENCSNGRDDDCDGQVDCADSDCANGVSCGSGRVCSNGSCTSCGGDGDPCCGSQCNPGYSCGAGNRCAVVCGGSGQPCCSSSSCSNSSLACFNGSCVAKFANGTGCGDDDKLCQSGNCESGTCCPHCNTSNHEVCQGGSCVVTCGVAGKACCPGNTCPGASNLFCFTNSTFPSCVVKYGNGKGCGATNMDVDEQCASNHCVNNICCSTTCAPPLSCSSGTCG